MYSYCFIELQVGAVDEERVDAGLHRQHDLVFSMNVINISITHLTN